MISEQDFKILASEAYQVDMKRAETRYLPISL
jgi:hypothetical protein